MEITEQAIRGKLVWVETAWGGWATTDGVWTIRKTIMGYWPYSKEHVRLRTGAHHNDAVNFRTLAEAKRFVQNTASRSRTR